LPADISRALAAIDGSWRGGLTWYSQEWEFNGVEHAPPLVPGITLEDWCVQLRDGCVRLGDARAAQQTLRCFVQFCWGRLLGYAEEPSPDFCEALWDVEFERIPVEPPLVCAIQFMDCVDVSIVTCDGAVIEALERGDLVKRRETYQLD
jgi:hypothetical protein